SNPGTEEKPFATIQHAKDVVRGRIAKGLEENVTVVLRNGTYTLMQPLDFDISDSGTDSFTITYTAYPGENPVISGGRILGDWQVQTDGLWKCANPFQSENLKEISELFINGRRATRARTPNQGYLHVASVAEDRMSSFQFAAGDIPEDLEVDRLELVFIHDWSISRVPVKKIDYAANILYPKSKIGRQHPMMVIDGYEKNPRYYLENDRRFCDTPGEWFQDKDGDICYFPLQIEDMQKIMAVVPELDYLIKVEGTESEAGFVKNLHFKGLTFEFSRYCIPDDGYAGVQATWHQSHEGTGFDKGWRAYVPAALRFERARDCRVSEATIRHMGGAGVMIGSRCRQVLLLNSVLTDISGNGIMIGESSDRLTQDKAWWIVAPEEAASGNAITGCLIENCGTRFFGAIGIWVGMANQTQINQNEIRQLPYTGVSVGWMWSPQTTPCRANIVENNYIHHVMQVLSDGGGIYTLGLQPGTVLRNNLIHDVPVNAGRAESNGMFLDEGTTAIRIENNLIYNIARSPLRFHRAGKNEVAQNMFGNAPGIPLVRYNNTPVENISLDNNREFDQTSSDQSIIEKEIKTRSAIVGPPNTVRSLKIE
ncbi:MAG: right-handed parallel beta-helix repeat-containing protein, partial [Calditrichales bacterium]